MNSILVTEINERESDDESHDQDYAPPVAKNCRRPSPATVVTKARFLNTTAEKLSGARETAVRSKPCEKAKELTLRYLVWLEVRELETHLLLYVPGLTEHLSLRPCCGYGEHN